ncbi:MAG: hypothetical protein ABSG31_12740 [Tepidisphaeraceae bacterium]|jgi:hypothetical protein
MIRNSPTRNSLPVLLLGAMLLLLPAGCGIAAVAGRAFPGTIAAPYPGLKKQTVGIMVWADSGITIDHPSVQADLAKGLQDKLQQAAAAGTDEVQKVTWYSPDDVLKFQEDHPEAETDTAEQTALKFPVTRLIYVELGSLSLHPSEAIDLSLGQATASVRVIEVTSGTAKAGYEEVNVSVTYPEHAPPEGVTGLSDDTVYRQTIDAMTTALAERFISRPDDTNDMEQDDTGPNMGNEQ